MGHGIQSKPIPIEKSHKSQVSNFQGPKNHLAGSLVVPGPQQLSRWELCDLSMGMGSCYNRFQEAEGLVKYSRQFEPYFCCHDSSWFCISWI